MTDADATAPWKRPIHIININQSFVYLTHHEVEHRPAGEGINLECDHAGPGQEVTMRDQNVLHALRKARQRSSECDRNNKPAPGSTELIIEHSKRESFRSLIKCDDHDGDVGATFGGEPCPVRQSIGAHDGYQMFACLLTLVKAWHILGSVGKPRMTQGRVPVTVNSSFTTSLDRPRFFINGRWVEPNGTDVYTSVEAATENILGTTALGTSADIDAAVHAARHALDSGPWGRTSAAERADVMRRFAAALASRADFTSRLVSQENGMPFWLSTSFNGTAPAAALDRYAGWAEAAHFSEIRRSPSGATIVQREPLGVVGAITPWNYPQALAMNKIAPALAAGCTVVLKPAEITALDAYILADSAEEAGLPSGVLNIVAGGRETGAALVSHPGVDKIAFTGSTAAGRIIAAECGRQIKQVSLELGGKSAGIVLEDANLDTFIGGLLAVSLRNNGQTCTASSRILAPLSRYDEVVDAVSTFASEMRVGNPLDPTVTCGPMASNEQLQRVLGYINLGRESDARLTTGGGRPAGLKRGWFVEPTVFANVSNNDRIAREEIFGPVLVVIPYDGDDEAVAIANDSNYGLAGTIWTTDEEHGIDIARKVRTGTIGVNYYASDTGSPFGGTKDSGLGRESGPEALDEYLEFKSIYVSANQL